MAAAIVTVAQDANTGPRFSPPSFLPSSSRNSELLEAEEALGAFSKIFFFFMRANLKVSIEFVTILFLGQEARGIPAP